VRIDPELSLLAKIKFSPPEAMFDQQLTNKSDVIGRVLAVDHFAGKKDRASIDKLKAVAQADPFYALRVEAVRALRTIHTDEAFTALTECLDQPDARVRQEALNCVTAFYRPEAFDIAVRRADQEKNPDIAATAVRALSAYPRPEIRQRLTSLLSSSSYRNRLADAAISAMRAQSDPAYIAALQDCLRSRETQFTSSGFGRGLEALAYLARNEENKAAVRDFLLGYVNHPKRSVQVASINALGTLADPTAIPALETFSRAGKDNPERQAADRAISALRAARKPNDEWNELRSELLELKKENREIRQQLEEIKKKSELPERKPQEKGPDKSAGP
jgi:aminopeptidase N